METDLEIDLLIRLAHGLGIALEMQADGEELREVWSDEVQSLSLAKAKLSANGMPLSEPAENVIAAARRAGWTSPPER
jgi:hypothetical protein